MNTDNQTYIIFFVGLALLMSIYVKTDEAIITALIGVLGGIFAGKRMDEHTGEAIDEIIQQKTDKILNNEDKQ